VAATNTVERYGAGAVGFHWATFVLVVVVGILGLLHDSWPKRTQAFWINVHAMLGLLSWLTLIARIWWRRRHRPPSLPPESVSYRAAYRPRMHWALYALMFVTPIVGVVTFIGMAVYRFGLFRLDFGVPSNRAVFRPTEDIHGTCLCTLRTRRDACGGSAVATLFRAQRGVGTHVAHVRKGACRLGGENSRRE